VATRSLGHIERGMAAWESVPGVPTLRSVGHRRFGRAHAHDVSADAAYGAQREVAHRSVANCRDPQDAARPLRQLRL
jgi:hypothetical protein